MSVIDAYISWSEGRFFIHTPSDVGVSAMGKSVSEAKRLFEQFVSEYRSDCIEARTVFLEGEIALQEHIPKLNVYICSTYN